MKYALIDYPQFSYTYNSYMTVLRCTDAQMLALSRSEDPKLELTRNPSINVRTTPPTEPTHVQCVILGYGLAAIRMTGWTDGALPEMTHHWIVLCKGSTPIEQLLDNLLLGNMLINEVKEKKE